MKFNFKILMLLCVVAVLLALPLFAQSATDVVASPDIIDQLKIWIGIAVFFLTEIISAKIKTPFSFSVLTYIVNGLDAILAFLKKIRPDHSLIEGDSHYSNPV